MLATGGFHSGAITLDSHWQAHEQVLGLPLAGAARSPASRDSSRRTSTSSRWRAAGSRSTRELRAQGAANVVVAGASLPGSVSWREASGEGIALASGYRAAQVLAAELGAEVVA